MKLSESVFVAESHSSSIQQIMSDVENVKIEGGQYHNMILPKNITAYRDTTSAPEKSRADVEQFLNKLKIHTFMWNRDDEKNSYLLFKYQSKHLKEPIGYKVTVPFIEKFDKHKKQVFNEKRSYRFFWHIFKNCMLMGEIGMEIEQIFRDFLVIGRYEDGTPMTLGEKHDMALAAGDIKALPSSI